MYPQAVTVPSFRSATVSKSLAEIAFTPVNTAAAVAGDPHLAARNYFVQVTDPTHGTLTYPGAPYRHAETPWHISRPAPRLGEHNAEIYGGELGLPTDTLRGFAADGII